MPNSLDIRRNLTNIVDNPSKVMIFVAGNIGFYTDKIQGALCTSSSFND